MSESLGPSGRLPKQFPFEAGGWIGAQAAALHWLCPAYCSSAQTHLIPYGRRSAGGWRTAPLQPVQIFSQQALQAGSTHLRLVQPSPDCAARTGLAPRPRADFPLCENNIQSPIFHDVKIIFNWHIQSGWTILKVWVCGRMSMFDADPSKGRLHVYFLFTPTKVIPYTYGSWERIFPYNGGPTMANPKKKKKKFLKYLGGFPLYNGSRLNFLFRMAAPFIQAP